MVRNHSLYPLSYKRALECKAKYNTATLSCQSKGWPSSSATIADHGFDVLATVVP